MLFELLLLFWTPSMLLAKSGELMISLWAPLFCSPDDARSELIPSTISAMPNGESGRYMASVLGFIAVPSLSLRLI